MVKIQMSMIGVKLQVEIVKPWNKTSVTNENVLSFACHYFVELGHLISCLQLETWQDSQNF
jgi:hypothetical protein